MAKVLLVIDDYQEMISMEALMRKLGYDAHGISNEISVAEQLLSFNPDLVIGLGKGKKFTTASLGERLAKAKNFSGKILLIFAEGRRPKPAEFVGIRMDAMLEIPYEEGKFLSVLSNLTGVSTEQLAKKLGRTFTQDNSNEGVAVRSQAPSEVSPERAKKYSELFKTESLPPRTFTDRVKIRQKWKTALEEAPDATTDELREQKKAFARALFKKS